MKLRERTLKKQIVQFMQNQDWFHKGDLLSRKWVNLKKGGHYMPSTVDRELRKLEECKIIAVKKPTGSDEYKWLPHYMRERYIPTSERVEDGVIFKAKIIN